MNYSFVIFWKKELQEDINECIESILKHNSKKVSIIILDLFLEKKTQNDGIILKDNSYEDRKSKFTSFEKVCNLIYIRDNEPNMLKFKDYKFDENTYYLFLDDVDRISEHWMFELESSNINSDLIVCNYLYKNCNNKLFKFNLSMSETCENINKENVLSGFYNSGGEDRFLRNVNNKFIKGNFLCNILNRWKDLSKDDGISFTSFINFQAILNCESLVFTNNCYVIYNMSKEIDFYTQSVENLLDLLTADLNYFSKFSKNMNICDEWLVEWYREERARLLIYHLNKKVVINKYIKKILGFELDESINTGYFESLTTELSYSYDYYNSILSYISRNECKYVGFDIFDTLIQRPFWFPTDLFVFLNDEYNKLLGKQTVIDFSLIRKEGEQGCRMYQIAISPSNEDVTLDQIYDFISLQYGIEKNITEALKKYEIELELKFCKEREIGKKLYKAAKYYNRKILIITDMYLPEAVIKQILEKNGYSDYEKLYISNEVGISKYSGRLFEYALKNLKIKSNDEICFIGDNYEVDCINSAKYNIKGFHVPKAVDIFMGINGAIYSGESFKKMFEPNGGIIDQGSALKFIGIRTMLAVVANKFFGNPFVEYNKTSDFNANPQLIGYYCAGMFLFAEATWLLEESKQNKVNTLHFVARDGYWPKKAYDKLLPIFLGANSNYLHLSRKAIAPLYMFEAEGIYELFLPPHILNNTPENVLKLLNKVIRKDIDPIKILTKNRIPVTKKFPSLNAYFKFAKVFTEELYDVNLAKEYKESMVFYFKKFIEEKDSLFDVGYSGRVENILTKLLGFPVNSYYFHEHEPLALDRKESKGFNISSFYSFKPCSAFVLREQIFTPNESSCTGFSYDKNNEFIPNFGDVNAKYKESYIMDVIQQFGFKFVEDLVDIFGSDLNILKFNRFDACLPFEYYMHYAKSFDQKLLAAVEFEDEFGTNDIISLYDYWIKEQEIYKLYPKSIQVHNNFNNDHNLNNINNNVIDYEGLSNSIRRQVYQEEGIFMDGVGLKLLRRVNKALPIGTKRREVVKKIFGKKE